MSYVDWTVAKAFAQGRAKPPGKKGELPVDRLFGDNGIAAPFGNGAVKCRTIKSGYKPDCYYSVSEGAKTWLVLLDKDGHLDTAYNGTGHVDLTNELNSPGPLAEDADGNVLCYGRHIEEGKRSVYLYKLQPDGPADKSFGENGRVNLGDALAGDLNSGDLVVSSRGYLVRVLKLLGGINADDYLVAYDARGQLDKRFGTNGILDARRALNLGDDGRVLAVAVAQITDSIEAFLLTLYRARPDGTVESSVAALDKTGALLTTFGQGGYANIPGNTLYQRLATNDTQQHVTLAGVDFEYGRPALTRLSYKGKLDERFNEGAPVRFQETPLAIWQGVGVNADGQVLVISPEDLRGTVVACYTTSGALDSDFAANGWAFLDLGRLVESPPLLAANRVLVSGTGVNDDVENTLGVQAEILALRLPSHPTPPR